MTLHDLDRLGPALIVMVAAGGLLLADLLLRERGRAWLPFGALGGLAASAIWMVVLILRDQEGVAFSGTYSLDAFSVFFTFLFIGAGGLVIVASADYVRRLRSQAEFWALLLLATSGMLLLAGARDLILIFIALELTSISQYVLASFLKDDRSSEAGLKYILLGAIASAVILYGMAFLFGIAGTTKLVAADGGPSIASVVAEGDPGLRAALVAAIVLLAAGLSFKVALVPFQMWVPDVYQGAALPVAAFLSVGSKAAGFAVVLRIFYEGLGPDSFVGSDWSNVFAAVAAVSMTAGNLLALVQTDVRRLLGYSSIAQAGNIAVGVAAIAASGDGVSLGAGGVAFFLATYAFTNLGAFFAVLAISQRVESFAISDYAGMVRRAPLLAAVLGFCLVSLTGIPPTAGFVAKVYIFNAAVQSDLAWLVIVAVVNTAISAYYYLRVVGTMYFSPAPAEGDITPGPWLAAALAVTAVGVLVLGIVPAPLIDAAQRAASAFG
ncbi:MAG: NADH-quinone oxidoreductase subunit N [Chloroflexi bacterium]|nr:NADH-quinone oxidoreductase subunit N [Chloroflexota bacterium]